MLINGYAFQNDKFLQPTYRISPFKTLDVARNRNMPRSGRADDYFAARFGQNAFIYTKSGRNALHIALSKFNLSHTDVVTIITTTNNLYISGCVTREIEKICKWSRQIESNTKVLLVNHEFGIPVENLHQLRKFNLPIIEDCAHSFVSNNAEGSVGTVGDYIVYSLPKFFSIQLGGILVSNRGDNLKGYLTPNEYRYIRDVVSFYIGSLDEITKKRVNNYQYLSKKLLKIGFSPRFELEKGYCPGVYMFNANGLDLNKLKIYMQNLGVESSVFYGEECFFIPVHQELYEDDLGYIVTSIKTFSRGLEI